MPAEEAVRIFLEFKRVESAIKGSSGVIVVIVAIMKGSKVAIAGYGIQKFKVLPSFQHWLISMVDSLEDER